jgi:hypothetical protein
LGHHDLRGDDDAQNDRYQNDLISHSVHFKKLRPAKLQRVSG